MTPIERITELLANERREVECPSCLAVDTHSFYECLLCNKGRIPEPIEECMERVLAERVGTPWTIEDMREAFEIAASPRLTPELVRERLGPLWEAASPDDRELFCQAARAMCGLPADAPSPLVDES